MLANLVGNSVNITYVEFVTWQSVRHFSNLLCFMKTMNVWVKCPFRLMLSCGFSHGEEELKSIQGAVVDVVTQLPHTGYGLERHFENFWDKEQGKEIRKSSFSNVMMEKENQIILQLSTGS